MRRVIAVVALAALSPALAQEGGLAELLAAKDEAFPKAIEPRRFEFPADHGPHAEYRNEWWYVTGNLENAAGRRFGFELTIFRFALAPAPPVSTSAWRSNQVYIAHLAVTDPVDERFIVAEKYSRGALDMAGAEAEPFAVWIDDWRIHGQTMPNGRERWRIDAATDEASLALTLDAEKPPVLNGDAGLSQKSSEPGNASYYYSLTRLKTAGTLDIGGEEFAVRGTSWVDREWSSSALGGDQVGWDWFALQLDDGRELMVYQLRRQDGSADPNSAGTLVAADGAAEHLGHGDIRLTVLDTWASPEGGDYPARWRLEVPKGAIDVEIVPVMADQELFTTVRYWEGAVDVVGQDGPAGRGYVELTGYAGIPE